MLWYNFQCTQEVDIMKLRSLSQRCGKDSEQEIKTKMFYKRISILIHNTKQMVRLKNKLDEVQAKYFSSVL